MNPSKETYLSLEDAFDDLNNWLFDGHLPGCLITLQRDKRTRGYYSADRFVGKNSNSGKTTDEIALNPDTFDRTDIEILSTLAHEMCHLWKQRCGRKQGRNAYHDREWANKMEEIGLMPSDTGEPGGKRTGQTMTHYIMAGGAFETVAWRMLDSGVKIHWQSNPGAEPAGLKRKSGQRTKYTCPDCGVNAWAKAEVKLLCGECETLMTPDEDET